MDFHSLHRRDLQSLCKQNKIPANMTNLAMANALQALPKVEGLDAFKQGTPAKTAVSRSTSGTARTEKKKEDEQEKVEVGVPNSPTTLSARGRRTRTIVMRNLEPEQDEAKIPDPVKTPATRVTRRRKIEDQVQKSEIKASASTRRSARITTKVEVASAARASYRKMIADAEESAKSAENFNETGDEEGAVDENLTVDYPVSGQDAVAHELNETVDIPTEEVPVSKKSIDRTGEDDSHSNSEGLVSGNMTTHVVSKCVEENPPAYDPVSQDNITHSADEGDHSGFQGLIDPGENCSAFEAPKEPSDLTVEKDSHPVFEDLNVRTAKESDDLTVDKDSRQVQTKENAISQNSIDQAVDDDYQSDELEEKSAASENELEATDRTAGELVNLVESREPNNPTVDSDSHPAAESLIDQTANESQSIAEENGPEDRVETVTAESTGEELICDGVSSADENLTSVAEIIDGDDGTEDGVVTVTSEKVAGEEVIAGGAATAEDILDRGDVPEVELTGAEEVFAEENATEDTADEFAGEYVICGGATAAEGSIDGGGVAEENSPGTEEAFAEEEATEDIVAIVTAAEDLDVGNVAEEKFRGADEVYAVNNGGLSLEKIAGEEIQMRKENSTVTVEETAASQVVAGEDSTAADVAAVEEVAGVAETNKENFRVCDGAASLRKLKAAVKEKLQKMEATGKTKACPKQEIYDASISLRKLKAAVKEKLQAMEEKKNKRAALASLDDNCLHV